MPGPESLMQNREQVHQPERRLHHVAERFVQGRPTRVVTEIQKDDPQSTPGARFPFAIISS